MGSIVKTIGKVIKKVGKALKKIAPILLVAAAAYVGYGYMTGFQQGGWPQITEWGKSLMGGVSQGQTLSQAANAAGATGTAMGTLDAQAATSALPTASTTAQPITDAVAGATQGASPPQIPFQGEGSLGGGQTSGLISQGMQLNQNLFPYSQPSLEQTTWVDTVKGIFNPIGSAQANMSMQTGWPDDLPEYDYFPPGGGGTEMDPSLFQAPPVVANASVVNTASALPVVNPARGMSASSLKYPPHASGALPPHLKDPSFWGKLAALGKKGLDMYKHLWEKNPGMAAWTTMNVIRTIIAAFDDFEEKESYRKRHVMGFAPGNWDDLAKKSGGPLPGAGSRKTGIWAGDSMRQPKLRAGPQIAGRTQTSAIDRKPQGLVGSTRGVAV